MIIRKLILFLIFTSSFIYSNDFKYLWSEYLTCFKDGIDARRKNIEVAVNLLDGFILYPNIEFSFIEQIIDKIPEDEMGIAPIISVNKRVPGIGGGLCQVATTLYNVALLAGISIRERKGHTTPVSYASPGLDSTISKEDGVDLKIMNPFRFPLLIRAKVFENRIWIGIFGERPKKREVKIIVEKNRKENYLETLTKRLIMENGKEIFFEIVSRDRYLIDK